MGSKTSLSALRAGIEQIYDELMRQQGNGEVSNAAVLARVREDKAQEISVLTEQLVDMALTKLLNDVSVRKGRGGRVLHGPDLFGIYQGIPKSVTIGRGRKKDTSQLTIGQAESWLEARLAKPEDNRFESFRRMVDECKPYQTLEDDTLATLLDRRVRVERSERL